MTRAFPMNEILLNAEEISAGYRTLKTGDYIRVGDLFQRRAGAVTPAVTGEPMRIEFERVEDSTIAGGQKLAGLIYLESYPVTLRPLG